MPHPTLQELDEAVDQAAKGLGEIVEKVKRPTVSAVMLRMPWRMYAACAKCHDIAWVAGTCRSRVYCADCTRERLERRRRR